MSVSTVTTVGKSKIELGARGCVGCGTEHSHHWERHCTLDVQMGNRRFSVDVNKCGHCAGVPAPVCTTTGQKKARKGNA